ncbi:hypothetical protein [Kineococcus sp. SYSU DK006]|uniref:hypothetical protein n=1 Tax=Kineococcus sp. SYSU DK006 TaxID=3383127 RepID=UPI003D7E4313
MTTPTENPGSSQAAESPTENGYGNDTGFAAEAEEADEQTGGQSGEQSGEQPGS